MPDPASSRTVLVVDDDPDMRLYLGRCLAGLATVIEASDGEEALRRARAEAPALVVCGASIPGLDEGALCRALRDDDATSEVPVLLVSSGTEPASPCPDGHITKPFNAATLRAQALSLLDTP